MNRTDSSFHTTWDQNLAWLQVAFNTTDHESTKTAPFVVIFTFRTGSQSINQWKINELLPKKLEGTEAKMDCGQAKLV